MICLLMAAGCSSAESESGDLQSGEVNAANQGRSEPDATTSTLDPPIVAELPGNIASPYEIVTSDEVRVRGIDPYSHPTMPLEELERFIAAVKTLDRAASCPPTEGPASLDSHVEILRIADSCMNIEFELLGDRTIWQARHEIMQADPTAFAVGFPSIGFLALQSIPIDYADYTDAWHVEELSLSELQAGWPRSSESPVIAVIDSGVDVGHPELDQFVGMGEVCLGLGNSHGTHVAGIASASRNDTEGIVGVAPAGTHPSSSIFRLQQQSRDSRSSDLCGLAGEYYHQYVTWKDRSL